MGGRVMRSVVALLLIGVLLGSTACTRPKPKEAPKEAPPSTEEVIPTVQPTPGQTVVSVRETHTPTPTPAPEVPVVPLPTAVPTSTATPAGAPMPSEPPTTHIVQRGETLYSIGQRYGIPWQEIAQANGITSPYWIVAGQKLTLPRDGAPVAPSGERIHIVQPGETLFRIGLKYGVDWQAIAQANGIVNPRQLSAGQKLVIP